MDEDMTELTLDLLSESIKNFVKDHTEHPADILCGFNDGKTIGTYIENLLFAWLVNKEFRFAQGNSARGLDFPELNAEIKSTLITQPQSSCGFESARQKVFGVGRNIILLLYSKDDDQIARSCLLKLHEAFVIPEQETSDYTTTFYLIRLLQNNPSIDEIVNYLRFRDLPCSELELREIAEEVIQKGVTQGRLTLSNALQWRLQYTYVISPKNALPF